MTKLVRVHTLLPDRLGGPVESGPAKDPVTQHSPAPHAGEHEIVRASVGDVRGQIINEKPRYWYIAALMAFRRPPD